MGQLALFILAGIVVLSYAVGLTALLYGKCTWEQFLALLGVSSTALYTYIRAENKSQGDSK